MPPVHSYDEKTVLFHIYDEHTRKITKADMTSLESLVAYLERPVPDGDPLRNIYMGHSFLVWMSQMMKWPEKQKLPKDIQVLCNDTAYPAIVFNTLCNAANINSEMVFGKAKDVQFVPGATRFEDMPHVAWNAFQCGATWHLVFPDFVTSSVSGHQRGGEVLLESDGERVHRESQAFEGIITAAFSEFWFCTKPNIIAVHAFPDDSKWQQVPDNKVTSDKQFETRAYLMPGFFMAGLALLTEDKCAIQAKNGRCSITIGYDKSLASTLKFKYQLSFVSGTGDLSGFNASDFPRMVVYAPKPDSTTFTIRLPTKGEYMFKTLVIAPGLVDNNRCFECRIICPETAECNVLPLDAGDVGFGYGHIAQEIGLRHPSQPNPTIKVNVSDQVQGHAEEVVTYKIDPDRVDELEFSSDFVGGRGGYATTHVDRERGDLQIRTGLEQEGEYAVQVKVREKNSDQNYKTVLNYIVSTQENDEAAHEALMVENRRKLAKEQKVEEKSIKIAVMSDQVGDRKREIEELKQKLAEMEQH